MDRREKISILTRDRPTSRKSPKSLTSPKPRPLFRELETRTEAETKADQPLTRELNGTIRALDGEGNERKFELSFSSEEPYNRAWCTEILDHSPGAVDITRLSEIGVLLYNHHRDDVLGRIERVWIDGGRGKAVVEFDDDDLAETIYKKVKSGTLKGVSVGYRVKTWEIVNPGEISSNGKYTGPCDVATSWEPYEVSIVSVPADPTVGVGRELPEAIQTQKRAPSMAERQLQININRLF